MTLFCLRRLGLCPRPRGSSRYARVDLSTSSKFGEFVPFSATNLVQHHLLPLSIYGKLTGSALSNNPLSTKIKNADFVFQAFTTTKTAQSLASSRAGNVLEFQYGTDATLIGASILDYRLERSRITKVPTGERNYHVFYSLMAGISDTEREHLALSDLNTARYRYLGHHSQLRVGIDDRQRFKQLRSSLKSLEFTRADIANICQILAAILHIGQLMFRSTGADGMSSAAIEVTNTDVLNCIAGFLGVRPHILESTLSYKTVKIQKDRVTLVLDQLGARENADELARTLYTLLFSWIMEKINSRISQAESRSGSTAGFENEIESLVDNTITVVDFPGFTISSSVPTLDKLLHNSANEMFYNFMLKSYFEKPLEKFDSEEVAVPAAEYFDNSDTVRMLFRPTMGLLSVIDDYSRREKDDSALMHTLRQRYDKSGIIDTVTARRSFSIRHFAGEVEYEVDNLIGSNTESISGDIISLFTSSSSSDFLKSIFGSSAVVDSTFGTEVVQAHLSSKPLRAPSVVRRNTTSGANTKQDAEKKINRKNKQLNGCGQFISAIDRLLDSFEGANPYFVICLKPNDHRLSNSFDARCVRQQIKAFGLPEIARAVKQTDFRVFLTFNEFITAMSASEGHNSNLLQTADGVTEREKAIEMMHSLSWPERDARYGFTGIFLSEHAWLQIVDPKMSFAQSAAQRYIDSGADLTPAARGYADNDAFYYDPDSKSIAGATIGGDLFKYNDGRSINNQAYIRTKEMGESEQDQTDQYAVTGARKRWMFLVWLWTWWIPDWFIKILGRIPRKDIRTAWREKFAINLMIWAACAFCVVFLIGFPILICPLQNVMSTEELSQYSSKLNPGKTLTQVRGVVFDLTTFAPSHYPQVVSTDDILNYGGRDSSPIFPVPVSGVCRGTNGSISEYVVYGQTSNFSDANAVYHDFRYFTGDYRPDWYLQQMQFLNANFRKAYIGMTPSVLSKTVSQHKNVMASLNGYVYDLSSYTAGEVTTKAPHGKKVPADVDTHFMDSRLVNLFEQYSGTDITKRFNELDMSEETRVEMNRCLRNLFMVGKLDTRDSVRCVFARYFLLAITIFVVLIILVKFLAALQFGKSHIPDELDKFFICQVPAYTEDEESLRRAIDSLAATQYDDKRKLLIVVCDGMIVGAGNERPTPRIVLDILGCPPDVDPPALSFESLGEGAKQHNMGKVYSGLYEVHGHIVPYLVLVKVGKPTEINRPGNRGKRDSQMVLMRFLNRVHYNLPMSPLELELYHQIQNVIGVNPAYYEYLLQVDADTMVGPTSASQFVSSMVNDRKLQAICGETALSNAKSSIVTMVQVYEYYISHNLAKAFESLFGSVTCLPGCFSMYRIYDNETGKPLFVSHPVVKGYAENRVDTLHMKNLLHLGEDRYLTTLLLKYNPRYKTKFTRHAEAWTVAPDTWSVFLSQRRRWINSTVHNLIELVPMGNMCGFCCFSMRFIVVVDLFSTIIQPVTVAYLAYLVYLLVTKTDGVPITSIAMLGAIYGLQAFIFLLRRRWEMIGWMLIYILAIPIFSLALPLYAFWHMDDFSWGNTRVVNGEKAGTKVVLSDEGTFDPSEIPLRRWQEYQAEAWQTSEARNAPDAMSIARSQYSASQYSVPAPPAGGNVSIAPTERSSGGTPAGSAAATPSIRGEEHELHSLPPQLPILPSDGEITNAVREILRTADLMMVTKKSIRLQLEQQFGVKLASRRDYINYVTEAILTGEL
ncbi:chitin synthase CHS3 [Sugiyamaella lignohabitans]|uniref:chitin synthase n=1 Tax=Sugiyamaella lignohabitans TaxID=796027 RepID=A0A167CJX1_9ASCO|nr:chitin synthase CHS3 [Sugiyamaella lignohabitans]ANB11793.1 chitin synthase CHS3 [Sugiyamaella lignohabitans]